MAVVVHSDDLEFRRPQLRCNDTTASTCVEYASQHIKIWKAAECAASQASPSLKAVMLDLEVVNNLNFPVLLHFDTLYQHEKKFTI